MHIQLSGDVHKPSRGFVLQGEPIEAPHIPPRQTVELKDINNREHFITARNSLGHSVRNRRQSTKT
jgi:hypothetical protein